MSPSLLFRRWLYQSVGCLDYVLSLNWAPTSAPLGAFSFSFYLTQSDFIKFLKNDCYKSHFGLSHEDPFPSDREERLLRLIWVKVRIWGKSEARAARLLLDFQEKQEAVWLLQTKWSFRKRFHFSKSLVLEESSGSCKSPGLMGSRCKRHTSPLGNDLCNPDLLVVIIIKKNKLSKVKMSSPQMNS